MSKKKVGHPKRLDSIQIQGSEDFDWRVRSLLRNEDLSYTELKIKLNTNTRILSKHLNAMKKDNELIQKYDDSKHLVVYTMSNKSIIEHFILPEALGLCGVNIFVRILKAKQRNEQFYPSTNELILQYDVNRCIEHLIFEKYPHRAIFESEILDIISSHPELKQYIREENVTEW